MEERATLDDDALSEHRVVADSHAGLDPGVLADVGGAVDHGAWLDLGPLTYPHAGSQLESGSLNLDLPVEDVAVYLEV
jgi:hypothetical protein